MYTSSFESSHLEDSYVGDFFFFFLRFSRKVLASGCWVEIPPGLEGQAPDRSVCLTSFTHWMRPSPYSTLTVQSPGVTLTGEWYREDVGPWSRLRVRLFSCVGEMGPEQRLMAALSYWDSKWSIASLGLCSSISTGGFVHIYVPVPGRDRLPTSCLGRRRLRKVKRSAEARMI